jgi:YVTN family beta-propeller protein
VTGGCARAPATVTVGPVPAVATVDPDTHTVYVGHDDNPVVSLVDARHCTALDTSGCDQDPPTTATALVPDAGLALDRAAHRLYAPAPVDDVVSAIDTTRCNAQVHTACDTRWPTIQTGASPSWVTLFEGRLYVADNLDDSVAVLPRRFRDEAPTVLLHEAQEMTVDPDDHTAYVTHANLHELALLDTRVCNARSSSRCHPPEVSIPGVSGPFDIIYDPAERTLYATNQDDHSIVMFDPATCNSARSDGCDPVGPVVHIGRGGWLAVDGARHRVYATDLDDGRVAVLDSRHCNARDFSGCTPSFVPAGPDLFGIAVDPVTGTVYASNSQEATVTVLDRTGAKATIPVGVNPRGLAIDGARRTLYVTNGADGDVPATLSIVDLRHCTAADTSGCGRTWPAVPVGRTPQAVAVDPVTHSVVTSDVLHSTLTFYDAGGRTLGQQAVGFGPQDVEVDPSSGTVFAVNLFEGTVSFTPTR